MTGTDHTTSTSEHSEHHNLINAENRLDRWGAIMGFLCAIHCLITPFSFILAPFFGLGALWTMKGELVLLLLALLFTIPSLLSARKRHNSQSIILIFVVSWMILFISINLKTNHPPLFTSRPSSSPPPISRACERLSY